MIGKLALRNLSRNRWRTWLTVVGVAVGVAVLIWTSGYMLGFQRDMVRGATAAELGQVSIADKDYVERPATRHAFDAGQDLLQRIEAVPGVRAATGRVKVFGLVGNERRSVVAKVVGIDPKREAQVTVVKRGLLEGEWLSERPAQEGEAREVVLGYKLAQQIEAEPGTELVLFFEAADGSLGNDLLRVKGIVRTNASGVDRQTAFMHIEDLQYAAALEGQWHEVAVKVSDVQRSKAVAADLAKVVGNESISVRSWQDAMPEIAQLLDVMASADYFMYFFVYLIVAFGLFNAQRMSALERRREFAMMMAIGVVPRQLFWIVVVETVLIVSMGAVIGAGLGALVTQYFVNTGLDLTAMMSNKDVSFEYMGISFSNRLYFAMTPEAVLRPVLIVVPVAFLCGLWPALQAVRTEITTALSGRD